MKVLKPFRPFYLVLYYVLYFLLVWLARILYPTRVIGKENLPKKSRRGYIIAPIHLHAIDPMYVLFARGLRKKMMIMGKEELFEINGLINFLWKVFGAFPVDRGTGNKDLIEAVTLEVEKGRGLLIFPEGTRSKDGNIGKVKSGAFVVAQTAGADIVPCWLYYSAGRFKMFRPVTVVFGKPLTLTQLGLEGPYNVKNVRQAKTIYTQALENLRDENKERFQ